MLDASQAARRDPAVTASAAHSGLVQPLPAASRVSVRIKRNGTLAAPFDLPVNRCVAHEDRCVLRLGPDEWMIIGPETDTDAMSAQTETALADRPHAVVDISHRNVAFEVSGQQAAEILNAGCPLDLHPAAFPPGSATRTLLGMAEIILVRLAEEPVFRVECWRSFATYVHGFLIEAERNAVVLAERD